MRSLDMGDMGRVRVTCSNMGRVWMTLEDMGRVWVIFGDVSDMGRVSMT